MGLLLVADEARAETPAVRPIPVSCLALFVSTLVWATLMLLLGYSPETTVAILSTTAVAVSRLAGLTVRDPLDSTIISQLARRPG